MAVLGLACTAQAEDDLSAAVKTWQRLRDPATVAIGFKEGYNFLSHYPDWPQEKLIRLRTEAAAMNDRPDTDSLNAFCKDFPPISGRGLVACMRGDDDKAAQKKTISQAWVQGDFNADEETRILKSYGDMLTNADHIARMDRLLYEGKSSPAKRMLSLVPVASQNLFKVRIAFINHEKNAPHLLNTLSAKQLQDPGILFERLRFRMENDGDHLAELLVKVPKNVRYPDLWWPMRAIAARDAMKEKNYSLALDVIEYHGDLKPEAMADALWLKGWILLRHRKEAGAAYKQFLKLYTLVGTPVSKARAAYWAARAAEANGNADIASDWLQKAARYPTVFYGQLALIKLKGDAPLALPDMPKPTAQDKQEFEADTLVKAVRLIEKSGDDDTRDLFLTALANHLPNAKKLALLADMAQEIGGTARGVEAAKVALRDHVVLIGPGWPRTKLPPGLPIEPALTLAITRQESQFDHDAKSPAGAMGLMQMLPDTAKQVAKRAGISFSPKLLREPSTNLLLGSRYLGQRIDAFDGSYIVGIASYNGGTGNVRKWLTTYGMPPHKLEDAIDWVESIPFGETRNYVMRVLENVSVYRTLLDPKAPLTLDKDLVR